MGASPDAGSAAASATRWRSAPGHDRGPRAPSLTTGIALTVWVGVAGPLVRAAALPASQPMQVAIVGLVAAAAVVATRARPWWLRLLIAAATAGVLVSAQGQTIAAWSAGGLLLGAWVGLGAAPLPRLRSPGPDAVVPVTVLSGIALVLGSREAATWQPFAPLAAAGMVAAFGHLGGGAFHRLAERVGRIVGGAVSTVVFSLLGVLAVALPWAAQRCFGIDPLAPRRGWTGRDHHSARAASPWADDPATDPPPSSLRLRRVIAAATAALLVGGTVVVLRRDPAPPAPQSSAALLSSTSPQGGSWHDQYRKDIAWVLDERVAMRPFEVYRLLDVETQTVDVHHGRRDSWKPPPCSCRRLTVWLYGGSGAFGLEQRDEHTIASELSRIAHADGHTIDVQNRGLPGQLHWRDAFRFAWDLSADDPPDLVVFYEGAADVDAAIELKAKGRGDTRAPYEPFAEDLYDQLFDVPEQPATRPGVDSVGWPVVSDLGDGPAGDLAAARFERARQLSADAAAGADVPIRWFWQPTRHSHRRYEGPPSGGATEADARAAEFDRAAGALSPEVTDLSSALDGAHRPLFAGEADLDERGARLVAEAMYRDLRTQVRALDRPGRGR